MCEPAPPNDAQPPWAKVGRRLNVSTNFLGPTHNMKADPDSNPFEAKPAGDVGSNAISGPETRALQTELAIQKDRYLHLAADFDSFRKRTTREMERNAAAQKEAFIRELLPVIDNLERALGSDVSTSPQQLR